MSLFPLAGAAPAPRPSSLLAALLRHLGTRRPRRRLVERLRTQASDVAPLSMAPLPLPPVVGSKPPSEALVLLAKDLAPRHPGIADWLRDQAVRAGRTERQLDEIVRAEYRAAPPLAEDGSQWVAHLRALAEKAAARARAGGGHGLA